MTKRTLWQALAIKFKRRQRTLQRRLSRQLQKSTSSTAARARKAQQRIKEYHHVQVKKNDGGVPHVNNWTLFVGAIILAGVLVGITALLTEPSSWFYPAETVFWLSVAYILFSWRWTNPVQANQIAVRIFFGRPTDVLTAGLPFVPLLVFEIKTLNISVVQKEFPAEPENVFEGELKERERLPDGMKPPIRITFRESIKEEEIIDQATGLVTGKFLGRDYQTIMINKIPGYEHMYWSTYSHDDFEELEQKYPGQVIKFTSTVPEDGLSRRVTASVTPIVLWRVMNGINFVVKDLNEEKVNRQIEDEMVAVLQRLLPKMSAAQALENLAWINAHLLAALIRRTKDWGIKIEGAYLKRLPFHHSLNKAIADATEAEFTGRATQELLEREGKGKAKAARDLVEETLKGQAAGYKQIADELGLTGTEVQAAEVARAIANGGNAIVVGTEGFSQLVGIAAAMAKKPNPNNQTP